MQTDILLKQVTSSLTDLKAAIEKFEKYSSPSTQYAEQLHLAIHKANKLVSAYVVLKEQKDVSPELDLHLKIMNVQETLLVQEIIKEDIKPVQVIHEPVIEKPIDVKPVETIIEKPISVEEKPIIPVVQEKPLEPVINKHVGTVPKVDAHKELPKLSISINDKFRLMNELFASNANEYHIAVEQLNTVSSMEEATAYLKGLKSIYGWDEESEMVKKLYSITQKRFS